MHNKKIDQIPPPSPLDPVIDLAVMHLNRIKMQTFIEAVREAAIAWGHGFSPEEALKLHDRWREEQR